MEQSGRPSATCLRATRTTMMVGMLAWPRPDASKLQSTYLTACPARRQLWPNPSQAGLACVWQLRQG